jgi:hypothetical protein
MANTILTAAYALYKAPHFTGYDANNLITINADLIGAFTPRPAWIKRYLVPGQNQVQYLLTFEPSSADLADPNILTGVYIEQNGVGVVIDCINVANAEAAFNGTGSLTTTYIGQPGGIPLFTTPSAVAYCISRADDGSASAHGLVSQAYVNQYVGNVRLRSNISGISHYTVFSYVFPIAQLCPQPGVPSTSWVADIVTAGACAS